MVPDNTPIIVGTGQLVDRTATLDENIEPLDMLTSTAKAAAKDANLSEKLLAAHLDTVAVVGVAGWHPQNAPGLLAQQLSAQPTHCYTSGVGGQMGVQLTNFIAEEIIQERSQCCLISGCNNLRVLMRAIAEKKHLPWTKGGEGEPVLIGGDEPGNNDIEKKYGLLAPTDFYPLFENAMRAKLGSSIDQHQARLGKLFSSFTNVAADNPYAWFPTKRSAQEITQVTAINRMIVWPYTKYLNSILNTEQAASLIMMSAGKARELGIAEDQWVYWLGGAHSQEQAYWASERPDFAECPSMKDTLTSALSNSEMTADQLDHIDFYSCFPIAVEMACDMLELDIEDPRGFTVTGGLPYAGGPASAYTLHSLATMTEKLRGRSGASGLVTGNGWFLTKHSAAVLSSDPHPTGTPRAGLIDDRPSSSMQVQACPVKEGAEGRATVEAYTVKYNRNGEPEMGIVLGKTENGERFLANTDNDPSFLREFVKTEQVGTTGQLTVRGGHSYFAPH